MTYVRDEMFTCNFPTKAASSLNEKEQSHRMIETIKVDVWGGGGACTRSVGGAWGAVWDTPP
jgi:hypothetical protein